MTTTPFSRAPLPADPGPMRRLIPSFGLASVLQHFWHPHAFEDGAVEWVDEFGAYSSAGARDLSVSGDDSLTRLYEDDRPYVRLTTTAAFAEGTDMTEAETGTVFVVARINTGDQIDTNGTILNNGRSSIQMNTVDSTTVSLTDGTGTTTASLDEWHLFTLTTPSDTLRTRFTIDDVAITATNVAAGPSRSVRVGTTVPSKREMDVLAVWTTTELDADTITDEVWPRVQAWIEGEMLSVPSPTTTYVTLADKGVAGGVPSLDGSALIPDAQIPATIARLASPALTGTPTVPTAALGTNTTQAASTAFVKAEIAADTDGWTYERLAADWTDATGVAADIFTGFAPAAGVEYEVEINLMTNTTVSTTAIILGMNGPASPQRWGFEICWMSAANTRAASLIASVGAFSNATSTAGNQAPATVRGRCRWTSPGAGNVRMQAKSEDTAATVTIYAKSYMRWRALP